MSGSVILHNLCYRTLGKWDFGIAEVLNLTPLDPSDLVLQLVKSLASPIQSQHPKKRANKG